MRALATTIALLATFAFGAGAAEAAPKKKAKSVPPITISGTVYTFDNQVPIAGATVRVAELPNLQATTGPAGFYTLVVPGGTVFTPYADAANHKRIYLQTFVSEGQDLGGVNFQMPTQGAYDLLAAIVQAPRDASGEITNCAVVSTFSAQQVRDLSHDAFRAYGAHGVAGAVAAAEPTLPKPIYFNEQVIPDVTRTNSSIDGGVIWPIVPTGIYRFTAFHPGTAFVPFRATCAPGRVVNANPTRGLYELRPGETIDTQVDAARPRAKLRRSGKVQSLTVSVEAKEYVAVSATAIAGGVPRGEGETRGYAPGKRNVKVPINSSTAGKRVVVEILATDAEGNVKAMQKRVQLRP